MSCIIVTGSAGLVGSEAVRWFCEKGYHVVGIDNDMRGRIFGKAGSISWNRIRLKEEYPNYTHIDIDITQVEAVDAVFQKYNEDVVLVIHAAGQPSHDWAATDPFLDFSINAHGTLILLENTRKYCPNAVFIFTSTNKVYGDLPNSLPLVELETRWEVEQEHRYARDGIDETMSIDQSVHSLFGVSKTSADLMVQEYGKYFNMKTGCFRCSCLTGPAHSGVEVHGFLSYLVKCTFEGKNYNIFGYQGKQVRDNLHSYDLIAAFYQYFLQPRCGEVYNMGGGRSSNCSVLEAIRISETITGKTLSKKYVDHPRKGDHIWWISDVTKFRTHFPGWKCKYDIDSMIEEVYTECCVRDGRM